MTNVFSYQGGSKSHAYVWEMDPPEHIHGHLLGGPFPMQQYSKSRNSLDLYYTCPKSCFHPDKFNGAHRYSLSSLTRAYIADLY